MKAELVELYNRRELLYMMTYRDIRVRYKQSVMGFLWAILMPVLIVMAGLVVRYAYALASAKSLSSADIIGVAVKSLPWAFLVSSVRFSCNSLVQNRELVAKIYFPKEIVPLAAVLACLFDFCVASGVLGLLFLVVKVTWNVTVFWVPILVLTTVLFAAGTGMLVSSASLFFRDVKYIVEVLLTFGIFFTPVFYDVQMLGERGGWLMLNPVAPVLEALGACAGGNSWPGFAWLSYSLCVALAVFFGGYAFFKHLEPAFAESI